MLKLAGELLEGQLAEHTARLDAHTKNVLEILRTGAYHLPASINYQALAITADQLYARPLIVARDITIDRIAIEVTGAGAGGTKARLGIYNLGDDLYPGTLLLDAGEVAVDSTGIKAVTVSQALTKGIYFMAMVADGTPTVYADNNWPDFGGILGYDPNNFSAQNRGWKVAHSYAVLPDPFTAGGTSHYNNGLKVCVRIASLD
ncbi:MAG: hypothetical protein V3T73_02960 [Dehalococcoidales bacterium]